ncbi:MAG: hypothetical protein RL154_40 [Pseudomonadota bacterium]|jgi:alkylhydroperoxidase/carboxymuconolactone decarboxylase family protein YurZ
MFDKQKSLEMINFFKTHYNYDTTYMEDMLEASPESYAIFEGFLPMATFYNKAPLDAINVARITSIITQDCGTCAQLYVDLAIEAGMDKDLIKDIVFNKAQNLPQNLKDLYDFTVAISNNEAISSELYDKINTHFSKEVIVEISLAIAATKVFPTIKKALNLAQSCSIIKIKV